MPNTCKMTPHASSSPHAKVARSANDQQHRRRPTQALQTGFTARRHDTSTSESREARATNKGPASSRCPQGPMSTCRSNEQLQRPGGAHLGGGARPHTSRPSRQAVQACGRAQISRSDRVEVDGAQRREGHVAVLRAEQLERVVGADAPAEVGERARAVVSVALVRPVVGRQRGRAAPGHARPERRRRKEELQELALLRPLYVRWVKRPREAARRVAMHSLEHERDAMVARAVQGLPVHTWPRPATLLRTGRGKVPRWGVR